MHGDRAAGSVARDGDGLLIVTFQDRPARGAGRRAPATAQPRSGARGDEAALVRQLEYELKATREDLQSTIDELESSNEELKASHEEVMSMNEELQSTNEEMETSKEELQSLNEELSTVNSQLQDKVQELDAANNDMVNLLASTDIATVFLDADLRIKRFTPPTARLLNLLPTDLGRPFRDIAPARGRPGAARRLPPRARAAGAHRVGRAHRRRARVPAARAAVPHRRPARSSGVVITWVDITERLAAEAEARHLGAVLRDSNDAVALLDLDGPHHRLESRRRAALRLFGGRGSDDARAGSRPRGAAHGGRRSDARVARGDAVSESLETRRKTKDGRTRDICAHHDAAARRRRPARRDRHDRSGRHRTQGRFGRRHAARVVPAGHRGAAGGRRAPSKATSR